MCQKCILGLKISFRGPQNTSKYLKYHPRTPEARLRARNARAQEKRLRVRARGLRATRARNFFCARTVIFCACAQLMRARKKLLFNNIIRKHKNYSIPSIIFTQIILIGRKHGVIIVLLLIMYKINNPWVTNRYVSYGM